MEFIELYLNIILCDQIKLGTHMNKMLKKIAKYVTIFFYFFLYYLIWTVIAARKLYIRFFLTKKPTNIEKSKIIKIKYVRITIMIQVNKLSITSLCESKLVFSCRHYYIGYNM